MEENLLLGWVLGCLYINVSDALTNKGTRFKNDMLVDYIKNILTILWIVMLKNE